MTALPETIDSLDALFPRYDALLCDVWGVVHNGETHFPAAAAALKRAREAGLAVVLITNSPRRGGDVIAQMRAIGVPQVAAHVRGETSRAEALAAAQAATRQYAKRQYTWFRHQPPAGWSRHEESLSVDSINQIAILLRDRLLTG